MPDAPASEYVCRIVNDNLSSDESEKHPYGSLRNEYRDRRGFKPSHNFKSRGNGNSNNGYFKNHNWNNRGGNNSNYGSGYNNKRGGYRNNSNRNNIFEEGNYGRKERFTGNSGYSKRRYSLVSVFDISTFLAITVLEIGVSTSTSGKSSKNNRGTTATEEQAQNLSSRKDAASQVGTPTKRRSKNLSHRKYKIKV